MDTLSHTKTWRYCRCTGHGLGGEETPVTALAEMSTPVTASPEKSATVTVLAEMSTPVTPLERTNT